VVVVVHMEQLVVEHHKEKLEVALALERRMEMGIEQHVP